jgi:hypothetical protein
MHLDAKQRARSWLDSISSAPSDPQRLLDSGPIIESSDRRAAFSKGVKRLSVFRFIDFPGDVLGRWP